MAQEKSTDEKEQAKGSIEIVAPTYMYSSDGSEDLESAKVTLEWAKYDAATIRAEFQTYHSVLPHPDELLQQQHCPEVLRTRIEDNNMRIPRFLKHPSEGGIEPHNALCCLLLSEYKQQKEPKQCTSLVQILSLGYLHSQLNNPAEFIRDQFHRVAHAVPSTVVAPHVLRSTIKDRGLPVPNYFLDPEDDKQFPPHIALLVMLQEGEKVSRKLDSILYRFFFSLFALVALLLRIVLEVIGGAGAIWGGAEVFTLRTSETNEFWRVFSIVVGILCMLRFVTLNVPQKEDEGGILGPAGPWSLRFPARLRAVCDHPFHYFVRALPPPWSRKKND